MLKINFCNNTVSIGREDGISIIELSRLHISSLNNILENGG